METLTIREFRPSTKEQRIEIMRNCSYQVDIKNEFVQWVTGDNSKTSLTALSYDEANKILQAQTGKAEIKENWAYFDYSNPKHKVILSLLYQANWVIPNERHTEVPDLDRLNNFLHDVKSPVKKPLKKMSAVELNKIIKALEGIVGFTHSKTWKKISPELS